MVIVGESSLSMKSCNTDHRSHLTSTIKTCITYAMHFRIFSFLHIRSWKGKPSKGSTLAFGTVCMRGAMLLLPLKPQTLRWQKPKTQYYLKPQSVAKVREIVRVLSFLQSPDWCLLACLQCVSKQNIKDCLLGMPDNTLTIKEGYHLLDTWENSVYLLNRPILSHLSKVQHSLPLKMLFNFRVCFSCTHQTSLQFPE